MGFDTRNRHLQDVEDDVDVDGEDDVLYGIAQFSEGDILAAEFPRPQSDDSGIHLDEDVDVDIEMDAPGSESIREKSLKDLVAAGKLASKGQVDEPGLTELQKTVRDAAAEDSVRPSQLSLQRTRSSYLQESPSLLCRICIDPYSEPTVSTGCWHTCCRECWLRCLGSTKLCPICKRITSATELRRIYL